MSPLVTNKEGEKIGISKAIVAPRGKRSGTGGLRLRLSAIPDLTPKTVLKDPLRIPVVLGPDFTVEETALHTEFDTVSAGQFSSPAGGKKAPQLKALSFDTLTLTWAAKWLTYADVDPDEVREELGAILRSRKPVELFAFLGKEGKKEELRMWATLRSMSRILRHGENDTRYYSLEWKQYRSPSVHRKGANQYTDLPTTYALEKEDTLRSIADDFYGTEAMWEYLAQQNGIKGWGGDDPLVKMNRFKAGDKVKVPLPPPTKVGNAVALTGDDNHLAIYGG